MKIFENNEFAVWVEDGLRVLHKYEKEIGINNAALVVCLEDGNVLTSYFNASAQDKAIMAHNINSDVVLDIVKNNGETIRRGWEDED